MLIQNISALNLYNTHFTAQKQRKRVPNLTQPHIDSCEFGIYKFGSRKILSVPAKL